VTDQERANVIVRGIRLAQKLQWPLVIFGKAWTPPPDFPLPDVDDEPGDSALPPRPHSGLKPQEHEARCIVFALTKTARVIEDLGDSIGLPKNPTEPSPSVPAEPERRWTVHDFIKWAADPASHAAPAVETGETRMSTIVERFPSDADPRIEIHGDGRNFTLLRVSDQQVLQRIGGLEEARARAAELVEAGKA